MEGTVRQLFYFSSEQLKRIKPFFRRSYGISRVDDLRVLAELFMSSGMACNGRILRLGIALIKTCITALYAGVTWAYQ